MNEVDLSPLKGLKFKCLEGCGFCCTFQPALKKAEYKFYQNNIRTKNGVVLGCIKDPTSTERRSFSLKKGDIGSCIFLEGKKCKIYDIRPRICREFPIYISFNWRIQLDVNMSCRGLWQGEKNRDVYSMGTELLSTLPINLKRENLYKFGKVYSNLLKDFNDYIPPLKLREKLLEYIKNMNIELSQDYENAKEHLKIHLDREKFFDLPSYVTKDLRWDFFKFKTDSIQRIQMNEKGDLGIIKSIDFSEIVIRSISPNAQNLIRDYLKRVVERDKFICHQYFISKNISQPLISSAFTYLKSLLDLFIMELNMLAAFDNLEIDEELVKEGIILMDGSLVATLY
ncbi:MAG: YkgJ family cysteine cluster protein [Candidatus Methanoperedens sp.]|nr:YkgJ family cysteine cluster protein [Candidatus Methanoperedens sp.]